MATSVIPNTEYEIEELKSAMVSESVELIPNVSDYGVSSNIICIKNKFFCQLSGTFAITSQLPSNNGVVFSGLPIPLYPGSMVVPIHKYASTESYRLKIDANGQLVTFWTGLVPVGEYNLSPITYFL